MLDETTKLLHKREHDKRATRRYRSIEAPTAICPRCDRDICTRRNGNVSGHKDKYGEWCW